MNPTSAPALPSDSGLLVEVSDRVATLTIDDPPWNRMSLAFIDALESTVAWLKETDTVHAIVFTGAGDENFSVGMNLMQLGDGIKAKGGIDELFDQRLRVLDAIENLDKPSVVTMYGNCLGGGLELPLACHFRLAATEGAQIGLPELDLGSVPAWGGTPRLERCVGRDHALDMILRARKLTGPEALEVGLVSEIHPLTSLKSAARDLALELAAMPRVSVAGVLRTVIGAQERTLAENLALERRSIHESFSSPDALEGMNAFIDKRPPRFGQLE